MKAMLSLTKSKALDKSSTELYGLTVDQLMETAAIAMARVLLEADWAKKLMCSSIPVLAIVGYGNNGGDALAVMRHLAFSGLQGLAAIVPDNMSATSQKRLKEARLSGVNILLFNDPSIYELIEKAGLVLDGISGTGFSGIPRADTSELIKLLKKAESKSVAIDIPSGICSWDIKKDIIQNSSDFELPVKSIFSLSVAPLKKESYFPGNRSFCGEIIPINGVFHPKDFINCSCWLLEENDILSLLPPLHADWHKGQRGALSVFAGATGYTGAAALCSKAAQAAGCGSVTLFTDKELVPVLAAKLDTQMVHPMSDYNFGHSTAVLAGPGWSRTGDRCETLTKLWNSNAPLVLDADALRLLAANPKAEREAALVLTPHPGEFLDLALAATKSDPEDKKAIDNIKARIAYDTDNILYECADFYKAIIVLKGSISWICDLSGNCTVWDGRNPSLAVAGSGDVLAGLLAGFLARGVEAGKAAILAVIVHAMAGRLASKEGFYEASRLIPFAAKLAFKEG